MVAQWHKSFAAVCLACVAARLQRFGLCGRQAPEVWSMRPPGSGGLACVAARLQRFGLCGRQAPEVWTVWPPGSRGLVYVAARLQRFGLCGRQAPEVWTVWPPGSGGLVYVAARLRRFGLCGRQAPEVWVPSFTLIHTSLKGRPCNNYTTPIPGLRIGPACEARLSAGMQREHVPPHRRKKKERVHLNFQSYYSQMS